MIEQIRITALYIINQLIALDGWDWVIFLLVMNFFIVPLFKSIGNLAEQAGRFVALMPIRTVIRHANISYEWTSINDQWFEVQ